MGKEPKIYVLQARLYAVVGQMKQAIDAANKAIKGESVHARALLANILARQDVDSPEARLVNLNKAIEVVSVEATPGWQAIDLAAVLSSKARLLLERDFWQSHKPDSKDALEALGLFSRIVVGPFPQRMRRRASDMACFLSVQMKLKPHYCKDAAEKYRHLGPRMLFGLDSPNQKNRQAQLQQLSKTIRELKPDSVQVLVVRGDESELLEWSRPLVRLMRAIHVRQPQWLVIDRTDGKRASQLLDKILDEAAVKPWVLVRAYRKPIAVGCISSLLAGEDIIPGCPLSKEIITQVKGKGLFWFCSIGWKRYRYRHCRFPFKTA